MGKIDSRVAGVVGMVSVVAALGGCGSESKSYDIGPIFPASADKCERYGGEQEGVGPGSTCLVTKSQCEKAVSDWRESTERLHGAIQFNCRD